MAKPSTNQTLLKALSLARRGDVDSARQLYQLVLDRFPNNKRARDGLAALQGAQLSEHRGDGLLADMHRMAAQLKSGDLEPVVKSASTLLKINEENEVLWNIYGTAQARLGNHNQAEHAFKNAVRLAPNFADALSNLAANSVVQDDLDLAVTCYKRALTVIPNAPALLVRMGNALKQRGDHDDALACFEHVLSIDPNNVPALKSLGILLRLRQNYAEAVDCFARVMAISPDSLSVLKNVSNVPVGFLTPILVGELQESLNRLDVVDRNRADSLFVQAQLDRHKGEMREALDTFCRANAEKRRTIAETTFEQLEEKRHTQLKTLQHWMPSHAAQTARIQTLIILGPSRSGKTTLEAMLQGSPHVASAYERWRKRGRIQQIAGIQPHTEPFTLADIFYQDEDALIAEGKHVLTATNPTFINHAATFTDMLPGVRFCRVQRDTAEIATEIFMTNYRRRNAHSYDPEYLLRYLKWYNEMTTIILDKVGGIVLKFEDILTQPRQVVGQVEALLGRDLDVQDLKSRGLDAVNPLAELFEKRFMK